MDLISFSAVSARPVTPPSRVERLGRRPQRKWGPGALLQKSFEIRSQILDSGHIWHCYTKVCFRMRRLGYSQLHWMYEVHNVPGQRCTRVQSTPKNWRRKWGSPSHPCSDSLEPREMDFVTNWSKASYKVQKVTGSKKLNRESPYKYCIHTCTCTCISHKALSSCYSPGHHVIRAVTGLLLILFLHHLCQELQSIPKPLRRRKLSYMDTSMVQDKLLLESMHWILTTLLFWRVRKMTTTCGHSPLPQR